MGTQDITNDQDSDAVSNGNGISAPPSETDDQAVLKRKSSVRQSVSKDFLVEFAKPDPDTKVKRKAGSRSKASDTKAEEKKASEKASENKEETDSKESSSSSSSRSRRASRQSILAATTFNVIFTGAVDEEAQNIVSELNGTVVDASLSPMDGVSQATIAVMDKASMRRTLKYLCCVAMGKPVV